MRLEISLLVVLGLFHHICEIQTEILFNVQCSQGSKTFNFDNYPACEAINSCIISNMNSSTTKVIDRIVHEFKCLIMVDSFVPEIPSNIFMTLKSNLTHFHANNISISELHRISFPFAQKLEKVDLSWNQIQSLTEMIFYDAPNLLSLNLSHNSITELSSSVFDKLDSLQVLDMSHNQITTVPYDLFLPLNKLVDLNLRHNRLQLVFGIFPENLKKLDLSYNNLEIQQKFKIFALLEKLDTLLLHGNRIENFHLSIFSGNIHFLGLSENLFSCNILADLILEMKRHQVVPLIEYPVRFTSNIHGIRCIE